MEISATLAEPGTEGEALGLPLFFYFLPLMPVPQPPAETGTAASSKQGWTLPSFSPETCTWRGGAGEDESDVE